MNIEEDRQALWGVLAFLRLSPLAVRLSNTSKGGLEANRRSMAPGVKRPLRAEEQQARSAFAKLRDKTIPLATIRR